MGLRPINCAIMSDRIVRSPVSVDTLHVRLESFSRTIWGSLSVNEAKIALIEEQTGKSVTYVSLSTAAQLAAQWLVNQGCRQYDVVAIFAPNSINWIVFLLAALRIGVVPALFNSMLSNDELKHHIGASGATFMCTSGRLSCLAVQLLQTTPLKKVFVLEADCADGCIDISRHSLFDEHKSLPSFDSLNQQLDEPAIIQFSSGTTGPQKAVLISHRNLQYHSASCRHPEFRIISEVPIVYASLTHVSGFIHGVYGLVDGLTIHLMERFNIELFMDIIELNKVKSVSAVAPVAVMMVKSDRHKLECMERVTVGVAPVSAELESMMRSRFKGLKQTRQAYGMTECGVTCITPRSASVVKLGSAGVPAPSVEMKVVDLSTGVPLGPGVSGEICFKTPMVMLGYANNEEATRSTVKDGWLHSGDIGYYDEDGYFFVIDRLKELIKYKGHQVAPSELESVLMSHDAVADAAVIGLPDSVSGELPLAWVVRKLAATVTEEQLHQYVNNRVAPFKKLRGGIQFVSAIPRTPSGKVIRRAIKAAIQQGKL